MARFIAVAALLAMLNACAHNPVAPPVNDSPEFNNCWSLFPPGPNFQRQMEEYAGTSDPNIVELGCIPLYLLDEEACRRFQKAGEGDWPHDVVSWCGKYFDVKLERPES